MTIHKGEPGANKLLEIVTAGHRQVPEDWMPASQVRAFIFEDPVIVWLQYHGVQYGFQPDTSPYEFLDFIGEKARQFEDKWIQEMAPDAVRVCTEPRDVRFAQKVKETFELMQQRAPLIAQPALWWAPKRIYGVPDLLVHTSWLREKFASLLTETESVPAAPHLAIGDHPGHYVVFDLKFTTKLDRSYKAKDLENYAAQIRIYSYILGHLQGWMPKQAFLITRDRINEPLPVQIQSALNQPLDDDLAAIRDQFVEIRVNGTRYVPWKDDIVAANLAHQDDRWRTAKGIIAREKTPGGDPALVSQIGLNAKRQLASMGYSNIASMLREDPRDIPLENCRGIGDKKAGRIRTILKANQSGNPVFPPTDIIPSKKTFEFYVDFEYFTNVNVDFDAQWPTLEGCEMVFMIGVGWEERGSWRFAVFVADAEDRDQEPKMFEGLLNHLESATNGAFLDDSMTALYHWTGPEVWQTRRAADRHQFPKEHPLRHVPWSDLQKVFLDGPGAVPGAWNYGLKAFAKALGDLNPEFASHWPADLGEGLPAMVMGWKAYETSNPAASKEMRILTQYLEADCKALWKILSWLRSAPEETVGSQFEM